MNLTTEIMRQYVGGQLEIVGRADEYRFRGQIKDIQIIPDEGAAGLGGQAATLHVEFDYIGRGPHVDKGPNRLCVNSSIVGEMSVFYPPEHNKRVLVDGKMEVDDET